MTKSVMRATAWGVLVATIAGYVTLIPSISQRLDSLEKSPWGHGVVVFLLFAFLCDALALWASAVWYAWRRNRDADAAMYPVVVLALTNFVGALFYYFFFVRRHDRSHSHRGQLRAT